MLFSRYIQALTKPYEPSSGCIQWILQSPLQTPGGWILALEFQQMQIESLVLYISSFCVFTGFAHDAGKRHGI